MARKRPINLSDSESEGLGIDSIVEIPILKRKNPIVKCEEDSIPLPNPFPLPKHYDADVECALRAKKMTTVARKAFIGKVASAMLCFKRYPTADDYNNVGYTITQAYPFMKSPAGPPAVSCG